jgi:hypothetical protein
LRSLPIIQTILALLLLALTGCATSKSKYELNGGTTSHKGEQTRVETRLVLKNGDLTLSAPRGNLSGRIDMTGVSVQVVRVLEAQFGKATLVETFYEKDLIAFKSTLNGKTDAREDPNPLHGQTVVSRYTNGIWTRTLKNGVPTPEQERKLRDETADNTFYPDRAVAVGETWTVPSERFKSLLGSGFTSRGRMTCTLVRITELEGEKCAVIKANVEASGKRLDPSNKEGKITAGLHGTIYHSLKDQLDVRAELQGRIKFESQRTEGNHEVAITMSGPVTFSGTGSRTP